MRSFLQKRGIFFKKTAFGLWIAWDMWLQRPGRWWKRVAQICYEGVQPKCNQNKYSLKALSLGAYKPLVYGLTKFSGVMLVHFPGILVMKWNFSQQRLAVGKTALWRLDRPWDKNYLLVSNFLMGWSIFRGLPSKGSHHGKMGSCLAMRKLL